MNTVVRLGAAAIILVHLAGCHDASPIAPRQSPGPPAAPLMGRVGNIAGFALSGATVEGLDDQGLTTSALTDRFGYYELKVSAAGTLHVRAAKEGYVSSEQQLELPRTGPANFVLGFSPQSLAMGGDFRVTLAADAAACVQLPAEVRTRTYDASLTPLFADYYEGTLRNGTSTVGSFVARVDGGLVSFTASDSEYSVYERFGTSAFLTILFASRRTALDPQTVTTPMTGEFDYCGDVSPTDQFACRAPRITCTSQNHTFTITRR